jgi:hypothetical protein
LCGRRLEVYPTSTPTYFTAFCEPLADILACP